MDLSLLLKCSIAALQTPAIRDLLASQVFGNILSTLENSSDELVVSAVRLVCVMMRRLASGDVVVNQAPRSIAQAEKQRSNRRILEIPSLDDEICCEQENRNLVRKEEVPPQIETVICRESRVIASDNIEILITEKYDTRYIYKFFRTVNNRENEEIVFESQEHLLLGQVLNTVYEKIKIKRENKDICAMLFLV